MRERARTQAWGIIEEVEVMHDGHQVLDMLRVAVPPTFGYGARGSHAWPLLPMLRLPSRQPRSSRVFVRPLPPLSL